MKTCWLHVSDFHLREGDAYDRDVVLRALTLSVARYRKEGRAPDLIFATGDIAYSGKAGEYRLATVFFDALLNSAGLERRHLFVIPGNHDCDRQAGRWLLRTLDSRESADTYFAPAESQRGNVYGRVDHEGVGRSLHRVGVSISSLGDFGAARSWFERAASSKELGNVHGRIDHDSLGRSLHQVAVCLSNLGDLASAKAYLERAVAAKQRGNVYGRVDHGSLQTSLLALSESSATTGPA
jgi:3',5'-cyclic AMP phosphodiesterase CpdA